MSLHAACVDVLTVGGMVWVCQQTGVWRSCQRYCSLLSYPDRARMQGGGDVAALLGALRCAVLCCAVAAAASANLKLV
jgi:hypothetical protein